MGEEKKGSVAGSYFQGTGHCSSVVYYEQKLALAMNGTGGAGLRSRVLVGPGPDGVLSTNGWG